MADNPFAQPSTLPFELPPFDRIHDEDFLPAYEAGMAEQLREVAAIAHNRQPPTFDNTIVALERSGQLLQRVDSTFGRLNACNTNAQMQQIDTQMAPKLAAHADAIQLDPALWARVDAPVRQAREPAPGSRAAAAAGALPHRDGAQRRAPDEHAEGAPARAERADLHAAHALQAERAQGHRGQRRGGRGGRRLAGPVAGQIGAARQAAAARGLEGKWLITLQNTTNQPLLAQLSNRALRERIYQASIARGMGGTTDNRDIIVQLVRLRAERAVLLGYPNHAAYQLEDESAGTAQAVQG